MYCIKAVTQLKRLALENKVNKIWIFSIQTKKKLNQFKQILKTSSLHHKKDKRKKKRINVCDFNWSLKRL